MGMGPPKAPRDTQHSLGHEAPGQGCLQGHALPLGLAAAPQRLQPDCGPHPGLGVELPQEVRRRRRLGSRGIAGGGRPIGQQRTLKNNERDALWIL